jgi:hypothetical protein
MENNSQAYCRRADLESSLFCMGSVMSFLTSGDETGGRVALMEYKSRPGNEPNFTTFSKETWTSIAQTNSSRQARVTQSSFRRARRIRSQFEHPLRECSYWFKPQANTPSGSTVTSERWPNPLPAWCCRKMP